MAEPITDGTSGFSLSRHLLGDPTTPSGEDLVIQLVSDGEAILETAPPRTVVLAPTGDVGLLTARPWQLALKRAIDVVGSLTLLVLSSPLFLLTTLAILLTSPGPVFFAQARLGREARPFRMFKFRSMYRDADDQKNAFESLNECNGPLFKIRRDPRITPIGRLIRRFSIDELPQLINILMGEMSLVGPRPPLPEEYEEYGPRARQRLSVTPGITCIWQVSGRCELDFATMVEMDLEYIQNWTPLLDLRVIGRTIPAVLSGRGAY